MGGGDKLNSMVEGVLNNMKVGGGVKNTININGI